MKNKHLVLVVGGLMAATLVPSISSAAPIDDNFCQTIGVNDDLRPHCAAQMAAATSPADKDEIAADWVAKSPISTGGSLNAPVIDGNAKNGSPGTPYQDRPAGVSNEVTAQIHRAMKLNGIDPSTGKKLN
jgi:hypothetical protein